MIAAAEFWKALIQHQQKEKKCGQGKADENKRKRRQRLQRDLGGYKGQPPENSDGGQRGICQHKGCGFQNKHLSSIEKRSLLTYSNEFGYLF